MDITIGVELLSDNSLFRVRELQHGSQDPGSLHELVRGKNQKKILFLLDRKQKYLEESLEFLNKILAAIELDQDDVAILNLRQTDPLSFVQLTGLIEFNKAIIFGLDVRKIALNIAPPTNLPLQFSDKQILITHDIGELEQDVQLKKPFWNGLKLMFDVG